jgi:hypothetical protein
MGTHHRVLARRVVGVGEAVDPAEAIPVVDVKGERDRLRARGRRAEP